MEVLLAISVFANIILVMVWVLTNGKKEKNPVTAEDIRMMVDAGGDNGTLDESEKEMINNIFEMGDTFTGDIATHRTDISAISIEADFEEVLDVMTNDKYSRVVVFEDNIDNVVGVLHLKDFFEFVLHRNREEFQLKEVVREAFFVPFSKKIDELFREMQRDKIHMAIVIDEYGGTAGLVTMEDIVEEIVGNIFDEYDLEEEEEITQIGEDAYQILGTTDIQDVEEKLEIQFDDNDDYDTLGGYLIGVLGRIPKENQKPRVLSHGWMFEIENIEEKRIEKVIVTKSTQEYIQQEEEASEGGYEYVE
ncbi:hemolysin family protein [Chakrabartyella piscis]|uniref:hemolysin family protein n=1 Tax=Chakrabartyella piscis TaxID=2918914 RepID=UPI002958D125|nr:hemolysin family protein [Chakrabartyella piscis]